MKGEQFGFEAMIYRMPSSSVDIAVLVQDAGYDNTMVERVRNGGLSRVHIGDGTPLPTLVNQAVLGLIEVIPDLALRTYRTLFAHSVPLLAPVDVPFLAMCLQGCNLESVPSIAVGGQPCAILHMAVQLAGTWLREAPQGYGILLIGADQAYAARERVFFGSAMGDVAVATFLSYNAMHNHVLSCISECEVIASNGEMSSADDIARFRRLNPLYIRHAIERCLSEANVSLSDVSLIVPHTPYTIIWDAMSDLLRFPRERILTDYISETGHLNSNDSFVHYIRAVNEGRVQIGDLALLVNPGFGGTRGCTLIQC